jgi:hypothetical protein
MLSLTHPLCPGADLRTALDATLAGNALPEGFKAKPSIGKPLGYF